jgi:DegT/DnrJ/EryC1/StrS aminotransferase family
MPQPRWARLTNTHGFGSFNGSVVYSMYATKSFAVGEAGLIYSADRDRITKSLLVVIVGMQRLLRQYQLSGGDAGFEGHIRDTNRREIHAASIMSRES